MNWASVNFDWNHARAFLVTAEEGSLSAAARALNVSQPTLGRQVSALEDELGVVLFERHKMGLELTPTGLELLSHVQAMADNASQFSLAVAGKSETLEGTVSISATETMATFGLPPLMVELRRLYPGIQLEVIASHAASDLKRREADIAIRSFRPSQADLIIRKIRSEKAKLYATPEYLESIGNPEKPEDLKNASILGFDRTTGFLDFLKELGLDLRADQVGMLVNDHVLQWEMVKAGAGIGIMVDSVGDAEPGVRCVLPDLPTYEGELWLVTHSELRTNRKVNVVFNFLAEQLSNINA